MGLRTPVLPSFASAALFDIAGVEEEPHPWRLTEIATPMTNRLCGTRLNTRLMNTLFTEFAGTYSCREAEPEQTVDRSANSEQYRMM